MGKTRPTARCKRLPKRRKEGEFRPSTEPSPYGSAATLFKRPSADPAVRAPSSSRPRPVRNVHLPRPIVLSRAGPRLPLQDQSSHRVRLVRLPRLRVSQIAAPSDARVRSLVQASSARRTDRAQCGTSPRECRLARRRSFVETMWDAWATLWKKAFSAARESR